MSDGPPNALVPPSLSGESGAKTGPADSNNALERTIAHNRVPSRSLEWRLPLNANVTKSHAIQSPPPIYCDIPTCTNHDAISVG